MLITRKSPLTGKFNHMELNVTNAQIDAWKRGMYAENAFPDLDADQREFVMTGITANEWDAMMGGEG